MAKRYTAAQARQKFSSVLDAAEVGESVVIERRGVRFAVRAEKRPASLTPRTSVIEWMDPDIEAGNWAWTWKEGGLQLSPSAAKWFDHARFISWTRDPFDRLLVAHALYRGWRLATADALILEHLDTQHTFEL